MVTRDQKSIFKTLGLKPRLSGASCGETWFAGSGEWLPVHSPTTGELLARVEQADAADYNKVVRQAAKAFQTWRATPAPRRGEVVRQFAMALREKKDALGRLVSLEMGKILTEGLGEVQEMIDICDYAVGLSRTLSGPTLQSERPMHRMMEQWHPLGPIGVITAFNFPVAVWSWNSAIAWVCGDPVVWKPSSKTPLCAIACQNIAREVFLANGIPPAVSCVVVGRGSTVGERMIADRRLNLISATGSTKMGLRIGQAVGARLGRTILELGGNNALIISDKCDITGALAASFFGAVGTAGQRCTSTRRLIIHARIYKRFIEKLIANYGRVRIGDPLDPKTLMGPLIDEEAVADYEKAVQAALQQGGKLLYGGKVLKPLFGRRTFVLPTVIEIRNDAEIVQNETFAP
ncbi:MAG: aldehyde dehydrogenase family protein, partial [Acidobacteria bacterium]|nr:aldehyde dehydrogenase family protein [Acidobacteriota bacterium]